MADGLVKTGRYGNNAMWDLDHGGRRLATERVHHSRMGQGVEYRKHSSATCVVRTADKYTHSTLLLNYAGEVFWDSGCARGQEKRMLFPPAV